MTRQIMLICMASWCLNLNSGIGLGNRLDFSPLFGNREAGPPMKWIAGTLLKIVFALLLAASIWRSRSALKRSATSERR